MKHKSSAMMIASLRHFALWVRGTKVDEPVKISDLIDKQLISDWTAARIFF